MHSFFRAFAGLLLMLHLLAAPSIAADVAFPKVKGGEETPTVITSNSLEIDNEKKTVIFLGDVTAKKDDWVIHCRKLILYYRGDAEKGSTDTEKLQVEKIVASGDVRILRSGSGEATAGEAVYYQADEKIILTEKPRVRQGEDVLEGSRITLFLEENRSVVEGSNKEKVRAVIAPRSEGR